MANLKNIRDFTINLLQTISDERNWGLKYGHLNDNDIQLLKSGNFGSLGWKWAIETYFDKAEIREEMIDLSIKINTSNHPFPDSAVLFRYHSVHPRFEICMMENFIRSTPSPLNGRVWLSALLFSIIFAKAIDINEIFLLEPVHAQETRYKRFGFYRDSTSPNNMSAEISTILEALKNPI